ncbi:Invasion protein IalB, involved in pathogenesis [Bradyrhizobium erythrophlei]|jgi:invasion protein IalB|uniref:Invasion protein IalB, involved in pathogenesis n=2 Tax=Bradyrhizobium erythrophlei TaxID=1437360 RepID=A0A1M7TM00_9BRAD|nr:Invasion protein IalB, involved in pathogenesis [Bradyrhizobium erythrophlei]
MRGYYGNVAFPPRNQPKLPFHTGDGLTGGLLDVGTEISRIMALIRRSGRPVSHQGAVIAVSVGCVLFLPTKFAEEIKGSTPMGPSKHPTTSSAAPRGSAGARWIAAMAAASAVLCWLGFAAPANAQGAVRSVHGDWQIRCDTPPGAQTEQCALIQSVVAEDRSNAGLTVIVLKTADQKSKLMRVVAPLGVLLPSGLGLKLDNVDVGRAGFVRCLPNGCVAEVVMDDKLLGQLKSAKTATFIIFETPEEGIGFPLSLNGLGEGYDKLP